MVNKVDQYETSVRPEGLRTAGPANVTYQVKNPTLGFQKALGELSDYHYQLEETSARLEAEEALQGFNRAATSMLLTGDDPFFGAKGKDAVTRSKQTIKDLERLKKEYIGKVNHPKISPLLRKGIESRITSDMNRIQAHSLRGQQEWDVSLAESGIEQAAENIGMYMTDPTKVNGSILAIREHVNTAMAGMPKEARDEKVENIVSTAVMNGILQEIPTNPWGAQKLLDSHAGKMEQADLMRVKAQLKTRVDKQRVMSKVEEIRGWHEGNLKAQLETARKQFKGDAELQAELKRQLTNDYNLDRTAEKARNEKVVEQMFDMMRGGPGQKGVSVAQLETMMPEQFKLLDRSQVINLESYEAAQAKGGIQEDKIAWANFKLMTPEEQNEVSIDQLAATLTSGNFNKAVDILAKNKTGDYSKSEYLRTVEQKIQSGLSHIEKGTVEYDTAYQDLQRQFDMATDEKGSNLTTDEKHKMVDDYFLTRSMWERGFVDNVEEGSLARMTVDNVPADFVKEMKKQFELEGTPNPTSGQVERRAISYWRRHLLKLMRTQHKGKTALQITQEYVDQTNKGNRRTNLNR